jgi:transcriptional regulator with XRE-family HTH domain
MTTDNKPSASGQFIRQLRQLRGAKQAVVAKKMGITQQAISKLENRKRIGYDKFVAIINLLGFTEEDIESVRKLMPGTSH